MQTARAFAAPAHAAGQVVNTNDEARSIALGRPMPRPELSDIETHPEPRLGGQTPPQGVYGQDWPGQHPYAAQAPSVHVNNNQQMYRPWREELGISFGRTVGNFFAFPVRLVGRIFEGILGIFMTIVKFIVIAVVMPTLIFTGYQMYEAKQNGESATEIAADVAGEAIGLAGAALGGIWDAIF